MVAVTPAAAAVTAVLSYILKEITGDVAEESAAALDEITRHSTERQIAYLTHK